MLLIRDETRRSLEVIKTIWLNSSDSFPISLAEVPAEEKLYNEAYIDQIFDTYCQQQNNIPRLPFGRKKWSKKTEAFFMDLLSKEEIVGIHNAMKSQELTAFYTELVEFTRHARSFAPELSFEELGQAIRNYIVYAMFKVINRINTGFSSAGYGYSMLYPFTDNYIDTVANTLSEKQEYNQLIRDTIEGKGVHFKNSYYKKTYLLLKAIEKEYNREETTGIYTLLLMILEAQEESISQQSKSNYLSLEQRLDISLWKGGVSVLVDRYLINKQLLDEDYLFYLSFGFFLQLADDLQDIKEDSRNGNQTLFTLNLETAKEEKIVNKLLNFLQDIIDAYSAENNTFKNFVKKSSYYLIYSSIVRSREFFSADYLLQIEKLMPVTATYLEKAQNGVKGKQDKKIQKQQRKLLDCLIRYT